MPQRYISLTPSVKTVVIGILILFLSSESSAGQTFNPIEFSPIPNSHNTLTSGIQPITISFNLAPDPATVGFDTIAAHTQMSPDLIESFEVEGQNIILTPCRSIFANELITITLTTGILTIDNAVPLEKPYVWQFRAGVSASSPGTFYLAQYLQQRSFSVNASPTDLNEDGLLDLIVCTGSGTEFYRFGNNSYSFVTFLSENWIFEPWLGDFNRDLRMDIFLPSLTEFFLNLRDTVYFWINFNIPATQTEQIFSNLNTWDICMGDLDGDSDLDVFKAESDLINYVMFNDGDGYFTNGTTLFESASRVLDICDLDNDFDLDIVAGPSPGFTTNTIKLYINDGTGNFTEKKFDLISTATFSLNVADFNNDQLMDIIVIHSDFVPPYENTTVTLFQNNGSCNFNPTLELSTPEANLIETADLNGDKYMDFYITRPAASGIGYILPDWIYFNNQDGTFTRSNQFIGEARTMVPGLIDLDQDGDLDVYITQTSSPTGGDQIYINRTSAPPDIFTSSLQVNPLTTTLITREELRMEDVDTSDTELIYYITTFPPDGELLLNSIILNEDNRIFSQDDINNLRLNYRHTNNIDSSDFFLYKNYDEDGKPVFGHYINRFSIDIIPYRIEDFSMFFLE